jgi:hypothetical protein
LNLRVVPPRYWNHSTDYTSPDSSRYVTWNTWPTSLIFLLRIRASRCFTIVNSSKKSSIVFFSC